MKLPRDARLALLFPNPKKWRKTDRPAASRRGPEYLQKFKKAALQI